MKTQPINKQNNISIKGLYFPEKPAHLNVIEPKIRDAFKNNPFIKRLSEESDIFIRYFNAENMYYYAKIDFVDIKTKKTKSAIQYSTGFFKDAKPRFSEEEFISKIEQPKVIKPDYKGNLSNKINRLKRDYNEQNDYYRFNFLTIYNLRRVIWDKPGRLPKLLQIGFKYIRQSYRDFQAFNRETMFKIESK